MTDTPPGVSKRYSDELLGVSPSRRIEMACAMFSTAKALVLAGARMELGRSDASSDRHLLLLRFYGADLDEQVRARIEAALREA